MTEENRPLPTEFFADWKEREALAETMIPLVGKLFRKNSVKTYIYGQNLVNQSVLEIMQDEYYYLPLARQARHLKQFQVPKVFRAHITVKNSLLKSILQIVMLSLMTQILIL